MLTATLVPLFVRHLELEDDEGSDAVVTVGLVVLAVMSLLGILLAPWIVRLYTLDVHGATLDAQREVAATFVRLFMPQMFFYGVVAFGTAMLNARRRFVAAAFAPVVNNVVGIAVFVSLPHLVEGRIGLARALDDRWLRVYVGAGTTLGVVAFALVLVLALERGGIPYRFLLRWHHPAVRSLLRLSGWTMGYVMANQLALLVVMILANGRHGGPFLYASAYAFFQLPHGLFAVSLMTTFAPEMARAAARDDLVALRANLARGLRIATVVIVPAVALYLGLARPLVGALLQHGAFGARSASLLSNTLLAFAAGLLPFSIYLFALRAFYSRHDTRTPFLVNCVQNACNIALAFPLAAWLGIPGLAIAFSLSYFVAAVLTLVVVHRALGPGDDHGLWSSMTRMLVVGAGVAGASWVVGRSIGWDSPARATLALVAGGAVGVAVAAGGALALRVDDVRSLRTLLSHGPRHVTRHPTAARSGGYPAPPAVEEAR